MNALDEKYQILPTESKSTAYKRSLPWEDIGVTTGIWPFGKYAPYLVPMIDTGGNFYLPYAATDGLRYIRLRPNIVKSSTGMNSVNLTVGQEVYKWDKETTSFVQI